jgi:DNA-binding MarR family transcriptional regulator
MDDRPASLDSTSPDAIAPVSFMLKRAAQLSADLFADQLGKTGLTQRQYTVLETVLANEGASQTDLVRTTGIDRSTLADLVNRLETQGYVRRERSPTDARVNFVFLTSLGRETAIKAKPVAAVVDMTLLNLVSPKLRKSFVASLEELSSKLDENNG